MDKNLKSTTCIAAYVSDIPISLNQGQGHKASNDNADPKKAYTYAKSWRSCFNNVQEKANIEGFFSNENMSIISVEYVWKFILKKKKKMKVVYSRSA